MEYNNNNNMVDLGAEIGWEDEISEESSFVLLEEGDYDFTVTSYERKRFPGSAKMCACNQVELRLEVGGIPLTDSLFLNKKAEWRISQFLISIGMKRKGVPCKPNWNAIPGSRGRCKVGIRTWTNKNGDRRQSNEIKEYYEPAPGQAPAQPACQPPVQSWQQPSYQQQTMGGYPAPNTGHWQAGKF